MRKIYHTFECIKCLGQHSSREEVCPKCRTFQCVKCNANFLNKFDYRQKPMWDQCSKCRWKKKETIKKRSLDYDPIYGG